MSYSFVNSEDMFETERKVKKFVLFTLDDNLFGLPIEQISQIENFKNFFPVPGTPDYVLGIMNFRGKIVTVINLKKRLNLENEKISEKKIIFIEFMDQTIGMLVEKILFLRSIPIESIKEDLDLISTEIDKEFLKGVATVDEETVMLLNLDGVLSEYEVEEITQHREKLEEALKKKEKVVISEEKLRELDLEGTAEEEEKNDESDGTGQ
ncbi:MAG: chemotaxis protein CheW [Promethearchaeota archaeon]